MKILDFIEASNNTSSVADLFSTFESAADSIGFDRLAFGVLSGYAATSRHDLPAPAIALNYPESWVKFYFEKNYQAIDPVVQLTPKLDRAFNWDTLSSQFEISEAQKEFFQNAQEAELYSGVSVPIHGSMGRVAVVSFASSDSQANSAPNMKWFATVAAQFHTVYEDLGGVSYEANVAPSLTPREIDCLSWAAKGKSSWDISVIIGISHNTVNYHMKNALRKFETSSRVVAVVKAIRFGLLKP